MIATMWWLAGSIRAADAPPLVLEHLTPSDGMPQGTVYDTLQDSQGFVWLATEDGLVRYDGHELVSIRLFAQRRRGLPGNFIRQIVEDAHHDLWLAIKDAGLARWNRATDSFTDYRHDPQRPGFARERCDAHRARWMRGAASGSGPTMPGIDILDPASGRIEHLRHDPGDPELARRRPDLHLDAGSFRDQCGPALPRGWTAGSPSAARSCTFAADAEGSGTR